MAPSAAVDVDEWIAPGLIAGTRIDDGVVILGYD